MTLIALYDRRTWHHYETVDAPVTYSHNGDARTVSFQVDEDHADLVWKNREHTAVRISETSTVSSVDMVRDECACRFLDITAVHVGDMLAKQIFGGYLAARTVKENSMPDTIDPATCKPDDVFRIRVGDRETVAMRVDNDEAPWLVVEDEDDSRAWCSDSQVTVLHRLVPEAEAKTLDVPMQPWDTLREAADIMHPKSHPTGLWTPEERALRDEAKRLEAEHRAAQEKAEQDAAIEKAAEAIFKATVGDEWESISDGHREFYRLAARHARAIFAAAAHAEAGEGDE